MSIGNSIPGTLINTYLKQLFSVGFILQNNMLSITD